MMETLNCTSCLCEQRRSSLEACSGFTLTDNHRKRFSPSYWNEALEGRRLLLSACTVCVCKLIIICIYAECNVTVYQFDRKHTGTSFTFTLANTQQHTHTHLYI